MLTSVALAVSMLSLMAAGTAFLSPCSIARAQSGVCTGAQTVTAAGGAVINEDGGSTTSDDFRVETDTEENAFFVDASAETITHNVPSVLADEVHVGSTPTAGTAGQVLESQGAGASPEWVDPTPFIDEQVLASDATRTSTIVLAGQFTFAAEADTTYTFELFALMDDESAGAADMDYSLALPAGGEFTSIAYDQTNGTFVDHDTAASLTEVMVPLSGATDAIMVYITGVIEIGGTAGNVEFRWAQNSSNASSTIMRAGTVWRVREVG